MVYKQLVGKSNSPLIAIKENDYFTQLRDIIKNRKILSLQDFKCNKDSWVIDEWRYLQLNHFIKKLPQPIRSGEDLMELEQLCLAGNSKNIISKLYKLLLTVDGVEIPPYFTKWERELGSKRDKIIIGKILKLTHSS